jgi:hypothetical protein
MAEKNVQQERFVITLTDHAPVRISKDKWPILSSVNETLYSDNPDPSSSEKVNSGSVRLIVRQHQDGRAIVYGVHENDDPCGNADFSYNRRGGELSPSGSDLPAAIKRVGTSLCISEELIQACIAGLPAVDLD